MRPCRHPFLTRPVGRESRGGEPCERRHDHHDGSRGGRPVSERAPICPGAHPVRRGPPAAAASTSMVDAHHRHMSAIIGKLATRPAGHAGKGLTKRRPRRSSSGSDGRRGGAHAKGSKKRAEPSAQIHAGPPAQPWKCRSGSLQQCGSTTPPGEDPVRRTRRRIVGIVTVEEVPSVVSLYWRIFAAQRVGAGRGYRSAAVHAR